MQTVQTGRPIPHNKALDFILGGNALFTLKSIKTGQRFTYKVINDKYRPGWFYVKILNGKDNTKDYRTIGEINIADAEIKSLSIHTRDTPGFMAISHVYLNLCVGYPMPSLEIWHEGRCCRCGRVLTVPESIENGIGPECIFKI